MIDRLREDLQFALEGALAGQNHGPLLAGRLQTAARTVLFRHGLTRAQIHVKRSGGGMEVRVTLPPGVASVRQVVLRMG